MNRKLKFKINIVNSSFYTFYSFFRDLIQWHKRGYAAHPPTFIKRILLIKNSLANSIWIETGTYIGRTAKFLGKYSPQVYTIEPDINLFKSVKKYLNKYKNIVVINETSEKALQKLLSKKRGDVNFFLDAHAVSNNTTKTYIGSINNPLLNELKIIKKKIHNLRNFRIFIDDVDWCAIDFVKNHKNSHTKLDKIIDWCKNNNLSWIINCNMMIIKNRNIN
jgi:hypothetical protein